MLPEAFKATPRGTKKSAAVPTPSVVPDEVPETPPPASVVTLLSAKMTRMMLLRESATYTAPKLSTATP